MKRLLYNNLIKWKNNPYRKPLILNGARQVGKTWLIKHFGENEYKKVVYLNCEKGEELSFIFSNFNTERIIRTLSAYTNTDITPNDTLIIIDEIQEYPRALTSLKYFCEDAPNYHIAVAGSLLGISLHNNISFPVGKVDVLQLYPMTFEEFLLALDKTHLVSTLNSLEWSIITPLSSSYTELLRQYYYVGGMPAIVQAYVNEEGLQSIREKQKQILYDYQHDFSKHIDKKDITRVNMVWDSIPQQLAKENKKFKYSELKTNGRASEFETAIQWLIDAGLIYKVNRISNPTLPLKFYEEQSVFKLFMLDVGLLGAKMDVGANSVLVGNNVFKEYKGAFTEEFVMTQLCPLNIPIHYYSSNDSRIEVDFVLQIKDNIIPLEVKAEENVRSKSLRTLIDKHPNLKGFRTSMKSYIDQQWMENIPLYALSSYFNAL